MWYGLSSVPHPSQLRPLSLGTELFLPVVIHLSIGGERSTRLSSGAINSQWFKEEIRENPLKKGSWKYGSLIYILSTQYYVYV